ncbi:uncharacterized protein LOC114276357 [Camellia sinensis]|uniref:uncharacterized protein LOC114276357 n=1 Tax=Camellia sinensis TaxID=4442 RepID=UPI001035EE04|nr:uncharacterized protein LOC114276357 [Camellia sinensis]
MLKCYYQSDLLFVNSSLLCKSSSKNNLNSFWQLERLERYNFVCTWTLHHVSLGKLVLLLVILWVSIMYLFLYLVAILPVVQKQHQLLMTLLLCHACTMEVFLLKKARGQRYLMTMMIKYIVTPTFSMEVLMNRPLLKTLRFNVLKVIPAGSSSGVKKAFTTI